MPHEELIGWLTYFSKNPPGRAEDYRAAVIMSAFAGKAPITKIFPSLAPPRAKTLAGKLQGSAIFEMMRRADNSSLPQGFYENPNP